MHNETPTQIRVTYACGKQSIHTHNRAKSAMITNAHEDSNRLTNNLIIEAWEKHCYKCASPKCYEYHATDHTHTFGTPTIEAIKP